MLGVYDRITFLKNCDLFKELRACDLLEVANISKELSLCPGEFLIRSGEVAEELYIVIEGELESVSDGRPFEKMGTGSIVGELAIIDAKPRSADVVALSPSTLISVCRGDFLSLVEQFPCISINVMVVLAERLRKRSFELAHPDREL